MRVLNANDVSHIYYSGAAARFYRSRPNSVMTVQDDGDSMQDVDRRYARLNYLVEKSRIYTSILAEKLGREKSSQLKAGINGVLSSHVEAPIKAEISGGVTTATERSDEGIEQPSLVSGCRLREYQLAGLQWLVSLYTNGLNGILADEMGLGKTVQTIAFLAFLREKGSNGPFLVAAPLSTISNWVSEMHTFAPEMPCVLYHGSKEERRLLRQSRLKKSDIGSPKFPVVVTSYEVIMNDRRFLQHYQWKYVVVDEGHRLKNLNCRLIQELKRYDTANRLLLTGTPLQNNLAELWTLLNFLLPDIFDDLSSFQNWFDFGGALDTRDDTRVEVAADELVQRERHERLVSNLHQILKPFLLRRLKSDVELELPPKREYTLYAPMTHRQEQMYQAILDGNLREFLAKEANGTSVAKRRNGTKIVAGRGQRRKRRRIDYREDDTGDSDFEKEEAREEADLEEEDIEGHSPVVETKLNMNNMVMQLRKACNHPYMLWHPVRPGTDEYVVDDSLMTQSGKMLLLHRLLTALVERGHRVLIFSQFTSMLDILQLWIQDVLGWKLCRIDGVVGHTERQAAIEEFRRDLGIPVFLISTRAGGLGINLTAADTVIIFDSDWNPQQDLQAQDRVHRIGQTKPVVVYRLACANSVETVMLERAGRKRRLEQLVIQDGKFKSLQDGAGVDGKELQEIPQVVLRSQAKNVVIKGAGDEIIDDAELERLLDRSTGCKDEA